MRKTNISDPAASVRQRLFNKARQTNRPFSELAQYFAMERFLYRLSKSPYADQFILKGALMLPWMVSSWPVMGWSLFHGGPAALRERI